MKGSVKKYAKALSLSMRIMTVINFAQADILKDLSVFIAVRLLIKLTICSLTIDFACNNGLCMMVEKNKVNP